MVIHPMKILCLTLSHIAFPKVRCGVSLFLLFVVGSDIGPITTFRESPMTFPFDEISTFFWGFDDMMVRTMMKSTNRRLRSEKMKPLL